MPTRKFTSSAEGCGRNSTEFSVRLNFHESLRFFLRDKVHHSLDKTLHEKTSVKDAIESCGVPHPEVDLILVDGAPVDFVFALQIEQEVEIFGVRDSHQHFASSRLQTRAMRRFVADGHLGKLTRFLRLLGIDVAYDRAADDRKLLEISTAEERALLTRDRRLLMHAAVRHGYYPRSQNPEEQTVEVVSASNSLKLFCPTRAVCIATRFSVRSAKRRFFLNSSR